jgi:homeobox protein cut-like
LSQGSVSELLSKPKMWHMLSIKGREPFIRMHLWLKDPQSIDKLQALKNERRDASAAKRKRIGGSGFDSSSDRSSPADQTDFYNSAADSPGSASKKPRMVFSDEQREALRIAFTLDPYPNTSVMEFLSQELNLETRSISNWFHNHRMRLKQQLPPGMENIPFPPAVNRAGGEQGFEPVKFRMLCHQKIMEMQQQSQSDDSNGPTTPTAALGGGGGGGGLPGSMSSFLRQFGLPDAAGARLAATAEAAAAASGGGLDLTFKSNDDKDSAASSEDEDGANKQMVSSAAAIVAAAAAISGGGGGSRSRRKPAAPQWLRPEWIQKEEDRKDEDDEDEAMKENTDGGDDVTINGVCVMRNNSFSSKKDEDEAEDDDGKKVESEDEPVAAAEAESV